MKRVLVAMAIACALLPRAADAFCGFYVAGSDKPMFNDATQVVLMRSGTRTVLSMRNAYKGPPEAFAMVVPVPAVLAEGDVKTLEPAVFDAVDRLGSPRLVEYWEQDPCAPDEAAKESGGTALASNAGKNGKKDGDTGVTVEAQFTVGEYQIVILSATESTGLETWLRRESYNIPKEVEPLLRPYVEGGLKFVVAKVDPSKVEFDENARAMLSPLRFHYDSEQFVLPIRLGLANSTGMQDLIVNIIAPDGQRYEVANHDNVTIPTNLHVKNAVRDRFADFYVALFDATLAKTPNAVVTEYAWSTGSCDPCPGPVLSTGDLQTLGADVLGPNAGNFTLTRLHARYDKSLRDDLSFRKAGPISGGREVYVDRKIEQGAATAEQNTFQARYVIRHRWKGKVACDKPVRERWGANPEASKDDGGIQPAVNLAYAPRNLMLASAMMQRVPELGLVPTNGGLMNKKPIELPPPSTPPPTTKSGGCCDGGGASSLAVVLALGGLRRRRRR